MHQRILVRFNGSPTSTRGLDEAIRLARLTGARLRLVDRLDDFLCVNGQRFETRRQANDETPEAAYPANPWTRTEHFIGPGD